MKPLPFIFLLPALVVVLASAAAGAQDGPASAPGPVQAVTTNVPSIFKAGRDPFFPESKRVAASVSSSSVVIRPPDVSSLKVQGISGTSSQLLAIINGETFAVGDVGEVRTDTGRVRLKCLDIHDNHVEVEVNGQIHRINFVNP